MALGFAFSAGCVVTILYVRSMGLLRTRRECYAARKAEGHEVPGDWDDDDG